MQDGVTRPCPWCGGRVDISAQYCWWCRRPLTPPKRPGSQLPMVLIGILFVAAIAAGGALLLAQVGLLPGFGGPGPSSAPDRSDPGVAGPLTPPDEGGIPPEETTPVLTGKLNVGKAGKPVTLTIGGEGGMLADGAMTLTVPVKALGTGTVVSIAQAKISGLSRAGDYGGAVKPVTSLFEVDMGDVPLGAAVTVTLQLGVKGGIPANAVPMAFTYDRATGILSPLAPISLDGTTLVSEATHFSAVLGALVIPDKLPEFTDSGFRPGVDDWQSGNWGSYVAPGGQCEGITVSEIWYYLKQHKASKAAALFDLYDNNGAGGTPAFWQDDSDGYRLTGSVQVKGIAENAKYLEVRDAQWAGADGRLTYTAFLAAMAFGGEPQMIRITDSLANAGHTMTVYRVTPNWLLIADPNYPGVGRRIRYDPATGTLGPFLSGNSAAEIAAGTNTTYTHFAFVPWEYSKSLEWLDQLWSSLLAGTAGDGVYPGYALEAETGTDAAGATTWAPLTGTFTALHARITVRLRSLSAGNDLKLSVYKGTSSTKMASVADEATLGEVSIPLDLAPGSNAFGFYVQASKADDTTWRYVDFVRADIVLGETSTASPSAVAGGRWVLASTTSDGPSPASFEKAGESLKIESASGSIKVAYNYDGPPHRNETGSVSWGAPPASAAPGETWTTRLTAAGSCKYDLDLAWAMGVGVAATWTDAGQGQSATFGATASCEKASGSAPVAWTFPAHAASIDNAVKIQVSGGDAHTSDAWTYRYVWQP